MHIASVLYRKPPDAKEIGAFGFTADDYADEMSAEVWPCQVAATNLFVSLGTQWRCGPSGPYGLDYNVLYQKMDRMNLSPAAYEEMEEDIRAMEQGALDEMRKN
jgi:hypothetical protein